MSNEKIITLKPGETITIRQEESTDIEKKFSFTESAKKLGISRSLLYRLEQDGEIKADRLGKSPKISQKEINKYLNR